MSDFITTQEAAENCARDLIHSWAEHGRSASNDFPLEQFPNATLAQIAESVALASERGIRGMANVLHECFTGAPEGIRSAFVECTERAWPPEPNHCGPIIEKLRRFYVEKRKRELADSIRKALDGGDPLDGYLDEIRKLESGLIGKTGLRERAYAMRFDPSIAPPPDEMCMVIGDVPIAARGNLTVPQGKSKVGKSALISAIMGAAIRGRYAAQGDCLCVEWVGESTGAIIHLDTEQSLADWHSLVCRSLTRSGMPSTPSRLVSLPLVMFSRCERLEILRQTMAFEHERGGVDLVMIDGVADLCVSPNDEAEALELVSKLHALAQEFHCAIFCVLHENPSTTEAKTRGHLGSELNRKAFANLRIDKDAESSVSTIYGSDMRKRDIPKEQGFCFAWDEAAGMHTFQGRSAGIKAAQIESKAIAKAREEWEPIFEAASIGTKSKCPAVSVEEALNLLRDIGGTEEIPKPPAMKKRMQRAEILGVLRKAGESRWTLNHAGQSGHWRDKSNLSPA